MKFWNNVRMFLWMTFLTGGLYPLLITVIAQVTMKQKADGNFLSINDELVGAVSIAQKFESEKYFWPRPSAVSYSALSSGASNLGPTSAELRKIVDERREKISKAHQVDKDKVPVELLFASGSGLDPHISTVTADFQVERVAKARGVESKDIKALVDRMVIPRAFGFLGEPCVNVLMLNKALDDSSSSFQ